MKKLTALLTAVTMLSAQPFTYAYAENENTDLYALAESLGANTDCLNIEDHQYTVRELNEDVSDDYFYLQFKVCDDFESKISNVDRYKRFHDRFFNFVINTSSFGISAIEVLAHNGVISPSDIVSGAETLSDITLNDESQYYISSYQLLQELFDVKFYMNNVFDRVPRTELAKELIETAEKCMAENRYFVICYESTKQFYNKTVTGIGITDGEWTFNDKTYDKCILTLDSNGKGDDGEFKPFNENSCIYINSETYELYCPTTPPTDECGDILTAVIDDETLLSYKAPLAPTEKHETDISDINYIDIPYNNYFEFDASVTDSDGNVYDFKTADLNHERRTYAHHPLYLNGNDIHIDIHKPGYTDGHYPSIYVENERFYLRSGTSESAVWDIDENSVNLKLTDTNEPTNYYTTIVFNEGYYSENTKYEWLIAGITDSGIKVSSEKDGILLSSDSDIDCTIEKYIPAKVGSTDRTKKVTEIKIQSKGDVLLVTDENNNLMPLTDTDGDGIYETSVKKGDTNYDGVIDAIDASNILSAYAKSSIDTLYHDNYNFDTIYDFNGDGVVDALDASEVLSVYAKNSVS